MIVHVNLFLTKISSSRPRNGTFFDIEEIKYGREGDNRAKITVNLISTLFIFAFF